MSRKIFFPSVQNHPWRRSEKGSEIPSRQVQTDGTSSSPASTRSIVGYGIESSLRKTASESRPLKRRRMRSSKRSTWRGTNERLTVGTCRLPTVLDNRVRAVLERLEREDAEERERGLPPSERSRQVARTTGQFLFAL